MSPEARGRSLEEMEADLTQTTAPETGALGRCTDFALESVSLQLAGSQPYNAPRPLFRLEPATCRVAGSRPTT
jgi:hypothetical protein